jgi:SAM-dependent methyltransferase
MSEPAPKFARHFDLNRPENWQKVDRSNDKLFYGEPRLVAHVDDNFIATLGRYFLEHLPPRATILDLMSSYLTHLPPEYESGRVIGQGMNAVEMQANQQLTEFFVQNLNENPTLPYPDNTFDAVLNTVSVQYLTQPVEVFREVGRVLKPGGQYIVSFSNRMFPTKAVQIWREASEPERVLLVEQYFNEAGLFEEPEIFEKIEPQAQNWWSALFNSKDPVYILNGKKKNS